MARRGAVWLVGLDVRDNPTGQASVDVGQDGRVSRGDIEVWFERWPLAIVIEVANGGIVVERRYRNVARDWFAGERIAGARS